MMLIGVLVAYLSVLIGIGLWSASRTTGSAEDYFLAGRSLGTVVLFMALFGTNVTAFAMIGLPGLAYHAGVGVFGFFGMAAAFGTPLMFILLGYPIWSIGARQRYITPSQMFGDRWQSPSLGYLLLFLLVAYTVPYLIVGLIGGGLSIHEISGQAIPYWLAAAVVAGVAVFYTSVGGMRGTAWTNVFQASVFLVFLCVACIAIAWSLGGPVVLHERLASELPQLLGKQSPRLAPGMWLTGILVGPVSVIAFPHMFMRLLAAKNASALRRSVFLYPWAGVLLFLPVTMIGMWGALEIPGLIGKQSDRILPLLVEQHLPGWLSAVGLAGILAAVMSSLDGQLLTLATMLAVDLFGGKGRRDPARAQRLGRWLVVGLAVISYLVALSPPESIFGIAVYSFSGYTLVIPVMFAAFFWRRSTAQGVIAGTLAGHGLLAIYYAKQFFPFVPLELPALPAFPVAVCLLVEIAVLIGVSLATTPPSESAVSRFAKPFASRSD